MHRRFSFGTRRPGQGERRVYVSRGCRRRGLYLKSGGCSNRDEGTRGYGIFRELKDLRAFNSVRPFLGSVQWRNGQDFCPDTLYEQGMPMPQEGETASA